MVVGGWAVTFGIARRGKGGAAAHPSTGSVPITVLLYNGQLLCGCNAPIKGLRNQQPNRNTKLSQDLPSDVIKKINFYRLSVNKDEYIISGRTRYGVST